MTTSLRLAELSREELREIIRVLAAAKSLELVNLVLEHWGLRPAEKPVVCDCFGLHLV